MNSSFSVVRFSPDPEEVEYVNVAVLVWFGSYELVIDRRFPKLNCVASGVSARLLREQIEYITQLLADVHPERLPEKARAMSAQFEVSKPRELVLQPPHSVDERVRELLRKRYLAKPRATHTDASETIDVRTATLVERFMGGLAIPTNKLLKRATPEEFLPLAVARKLTDTMKVTRVINGAQDLVLLEGLDLAKFPAAYAQQRAEQVAYNYYRLGKLRDELRQLATRQMHRAVLVFGEAMNEKTEFAIELVKRDSDYVVATDRPPSTFVALAKRAAETLAA